MSDPNTPIRFPSVGWKETSPNVRLEPDMKLGTHFTLVRSLGEGGMGEVWLASDSRRAFGDSSGLVALKFLPSVLSTSPRELRRVQETFAKVHLLKHEHICMTCDLTEMEDRGWVLVMEYFDGIGLLEYRDQYVAKHGAFPVTEVVRLLYPVAKALDYAHNRTNPNTKEKLGIVHRDIKPENILVSHDGEHVQIIDFGLAEQIRTSMTLVSRVQFDSAGTIPYMAPEQWERKKQDGRTDQYALGVVAYELLTDELPFSGSDVAVIMQQVLKMPPPEHDEIPQAVYDVLSRAMSKSMSERFSSCADLIEALRKSSLSVVPQTESIRSETLKVVPSEQPPCESVEQYTLQQETRSQEGPELDEKDTSRRDSEQTTQLFSESDEQVDAVFHSAKQSTQTTPILSSELLLEKEDSTNFAPRTLYSTHSWQLCDYLRSIGVESITIEEAEILKHHPHWQELDLSFLKEFPKTIAEVFGRYSLYGNNLSLDGLVTLEDDSAEALSTHLGGLSLNGLTTLSDRAVKALSKHQGPLSLNGLATLSDSMAEAFSKSSQPFSLIGIKSLTIGVAEALSKFRGSWLILDGLTSVNEVVAEALSRYQGELSLDGLTNLPNQVAEYLSRHRGRLCLHGLTTLSDETMEILSSHQGRVFFNDTLSSDINSKSESILTFPEEISEKSEFSILQRLNNRKPKSISVEEVEMLAGVKQLKMPWLKYLTDGVAEKLGDCYRELELDGVTSISFRVAQSLSKKGWWAKLSLNGLTSLSEDVAETLCKRSHISLNGLTSLSEGQAAALSRGGSLSLDGITSLSESVAIELSKSRGLSLNGLTSLPENLASALSHTNGFLWFDGVTSLSDSAAIELIANDVRRLGLNGLPSLSLSLAVVLSTYKGECLSLGGVNRLSDKVAMFLAKYQGELFLNGLTCLTDSEAKAFQGFTRYLSIDCLDSISKEAALSLLRLKSLSSNTEKRLKRIVGPTVEEYGKADELGKKVEKHEKPDLKPAKKGWLLEMFRKAP
jgi:serine/threonine protein kinase